MEKGRREAGRGLLEVNGATLLLGFVALFPRLIHLPPVEIIFGRCAVAAAALGLLMLIRRRRPRLPGLRDYVAVLFLGTLLATHWVFYFQAVQVSTVAVAIISLFTFPVITVLLEPVVFRTSLAWSDVLTALAVLAGIALMVPGFAMGSDVGRGVFWGVSSAFLYAARNVFQKKYLTAPPSSVVMFHQVSVGALVLIPFLPRQFADDAQSWALPLVALGVFFTALPHTLLLRSLGHLKAKTVGIVQSLQPAYGVALAAIFLSEYPSLRTLSGGAVILGAALYESARVSRPATGGSAQGKTPS